MASISNRVRLATAADEVWDALRDFGALHQRLVPGFVTDCRLDGDARVVTFANGMTVRELLVDADETTRRLVYAIVDGPATHYQGSAQVLSSGPRESELVWIIDLLPHEMASQVAPMAAQGAAAMQKKFGTPAG